MPKGGEDNLEDENIGLEEAEERFRLAQMAKTKMGAINQGISLGRRLRGEIRNGRFEGGTFYTVLVLSLIKDTVDIATLSLFGPFLNVVITIALYIVFFMQGTRLKAYLVKRFLGAAIVEFIPGICVFPTYTFMTILLKIKTDQKIRDLEYKLSQVQKQTEALNRAV